MTEEWSHKVPYSLPIISSLWFCQPTSTDLIRFAPELRTKNTHEYVNCFNNTAKGAKGQCQTWDNKETECWEDFKQGPVTVNNKGLTFIQN